MATKPASPAGLSRLDLPAEHGAPHRPYKILYASLYADVRPTFVVDITPHIETRLQSLLAYRSQYGTQPTGAGLFVPEDDIRERMFATARHYGLLAGVRYAEPFVQREVASVHDLMMLPVAKHLAQQSSSPAVATERRQPLLHEPSRQLRAVQYSGATNSKRGLRSIARSDTPPHPSTNTAPAGTTSASTRSRYRSADALKSSTPGSSTLSDTSGCRNRSTLFDSTIAFSDSASSSRTRGIASLNCPCRVRTQNDRSAPAARYRDESVPLARRAPR